MGWGEGIETPEQLHCSCHGVEIEMTIMAWGKRGLCIYTHIHTGTDSNLPHTPLGKPWCGRIP